MFRRMTQSGIVTEMSIAAEPLAIPEVILFRPRKFEDDRGYFMETFRASLLKEAGREIFFVQDNQSRSKLPGTVRGLHFQTPPAAQAKVVRVVRGSILDVAVDLRRASPTYGRWVGVTLTAESGHSLFVPRGFAHGFCTLEPDTEVAYKCDAYYSPADDAGLNFADPTLAIDWPVSPDKAILSAKDGALPLFADFDSPF
jgi:dTDP-4-dehydrorhamnose 3,5-epimerase